MTLTALLTACYPALATPTPIDPCNIPAYPKLNVKFIKGPDGMVGVYTGDAKVLAKWFFDIGEWKAAVRRCPYVVEAGRD